MSSSYPKTVEEYWQQVDQHWDNLYNILFMFLPKEQIKDADNLRLQKDKKIVKLFHDAWYAAPDNPSIHSIPSWHVLCNLCSEDYLLYEDEIIEEEMKKKVEDQDDEWFF